MSEFSNALESCVLTSDIGESLKSLVPYSDDYLYILYTHSLSQGSLEYMTQIQEFCSKTPITVNKNKLKFRYLNLLYDNSMSAQEKSKVINTILKDYLPHYQELKPSNPNFLLNKLDTHSKESTTNNVYNEPIIATSEYEKLYHGALTISNFRAHEIGNITFTKLKKKQFMDVLNTLENYDGVNSTFFTKYKLILEKMKNKNKIAELSRSIVSKFTLEQLSYIIKEIPFLLDDANVVSALLSKKFSKELNQEIQVHLTYQQKIESYKAIYTYCETLPEKYYSIKCEMLLNLLGIMMKQNVFEESTFVEYLKYPSYYDEGILKQKKANNKYDVYSYLPTFRNIQPDLSKCNQYTNPMLNSQTHVTMKYCLQQMFERNHQASEFTNYFRRQFLFPVYDEWLYLKGGSVEVNQYNKLMLENLTKRIEIEICSYNKDIYMLDEDVTIYANIKNIPLLYVKVFEINTENYYKKNLAPFNSDINLDGLVASDEYSIEYKQTPQILHNELFKFPQLKQKIGLYVVEFMGNGRSSRAIIKKGTLSVIEKPTIAGQMAFILDAERKIGNTPESGIWIENKFYKCNPEKNGRIIIPYVDSPRTVKAILMHKGVSQLVDFARLCENYEVTCSFILLPECVLMGKKATILMRPNVMINGRKADMKLLENCKVELFSVNFIDNIPITQSFNVLSIKPSEEIEIPFQVPPNLKSIKIDFSCEINSISKNKKEQFKSSQNFNVVSNENSYSILDLYLRKSKDYYEVLLLGKNGEPLPGCSIQLKIQHNIHNVPNVTTLTTDEMGKVSVLASKCITNILAEVNMTSGERLFKSWAIASSEELSTPINIDIIENETIEIPTTLSNINNSNVSLLRYDNGEIISSFYANISVINKSEHYKILSIKPLTEGLYKLRIGIKIITVNVHKGCYWDTEKFILKSHSLIETIQQAKPIKINSVSLVDDKLPSKRLAIKIDDYTSDCRVHVMLSQFLPENHKLFGSELLKGVTERFSKAEYHFQEWHNFFLSNRELGDELRYVFDRRSLKRFTGNTLDKPKLLLKRLYIQTTHTNKQPIQPPAQYFQKFENTCNNMPVFGSQPQCISQPTMLGFGSNSNCNQLIPPTSFNQQQCISQPTTFGFGSNNNCNQPIPPPTSFTNQSAMQQQSQIPNRNMPSIGMQNNATRSAGLFGAPAASLFGTQQSIPPATTSTGLFTNRHIPPTTTTSNSLFNNPIAQLLASNPSNAVLCGGLPPPQQFNPVMGGTSYSSIPQGGVAPTNYFTSESNPSNGIFSNSKNSNQLSSEIADATSNSIYYFQNFIATEPYVAYNLKPDANGIVQMIINDCSYNNILVIAVDQSSVASLNTSTDGCETKKRNLSQVGALDSKKNYCESRNTLNVSKHSEVSILDLASTEYMIIDSLERVYSAQKKIATIKGKFENDEFKFLLEWNLLSSEDKNKKLTKYSSHELHIFIKNKDPAYFSTVVKPYLQNKMEKTFVDHCLLENYAQIEGYIPKFHQLNELEKCLLISALIQAKKNNVALNLYQNMSSYQKTLSLQTAYYNQMFDTVLSLHKMKETEINTCSTLPPDPMQAESTSMFNNNTAPGASNNIFGFNQAQAASQFYNYKMITPGIFNEEENYDMHYEKRKQRSQFEGTDETKEYAETHYYNHKNILMNKSRALPSQFWVDYAKFLVEKKSDQFLSRNFIYCTRTETEIISALAFLDLPFESSDHGFKTNAGRGATIKAASNFILFAKEIKESDAELKTNILIIQRYYTYKGDRDADNIEEFITNEVYCCEVVITNITSKQTEFQYLIQIPEGSLPVKNSPYMKSYSATLNSYSTIKSEYYFYFPSHGNFRHFGATASINSIIVAKASENTMKVVKEKTIYNKQNFVDVFVSGDHKSILNFTRENNILDSKTGYRGDLIYWLLNEKSFYIEFITILKQKAIFDPHVWYYAFVHHDEISIREYFMNEPISLVLYLKSSLLNIAPADMGIRHLDYYPLINARAHKIGDEEKMTNPNLKMIYHTLIEYLFEKGSMSAIDRLNISYYLLLQDRVSEAINVLSQVKEEDIGSSVRIQYDYMKAYIDFFIGGPKYETAKAIVDKYQNYPIISWRLLMIDMKEQLKEYEGLNVDTEIDREEEESKTRNKRKSIMVEPQLSIDLEGKSIVIDYLNIATATIKYYIIDLEVLFSRSPFLAKNTENFSYVKPHSIAEIQLQKNQQTIKISIPNEYINKNVVIEVSSEGIQKFQTYFSNALKVHVLENYGEVKVTDEKGKPLPKVYVKAFAECQTGKVEFYKDGYTDIRGRFDYVSLNTQDIASIKRFALFIMSDELGSAIKECNPPKGKAFKEEEGIVARSKASQNVLKATNYFK